MLVGAIAPGEGGPHVLPELRGGAAPRARVLPGLWRSPPMGTPATDRSEDDPVVPRHPGRRGGCTGRSAPGQSVLRGVRDAGTRRFGPRPEPPCAVLHLGR